MVITTTSNRNIFYVCSFCWWHAREGDPGHTKKCESTHGSKNWRTYFAHARLNWQLGYNFGSGVLLMNDLWRSNPQSPEWTWPGLGPGIWPQVGTINRAPENKFTIIRELFLVLFILFCTTFQFRFVCSLFGLFCWSDTNTPRPCSTNKIGGSQHFPLPPAASSRLLHLNRKWWRSLGSL